MVIIPLFLVGGGFLWIYSNEVQSNLIVQNEDYLMMNIARMEAALGGVERQSAQWLQQNIGATSRPLEDGFSEDHLHLLRLVNSMEVQKNSNDWMDRIIYRHFGSGLVLDSEYGNVVAYSYPYWGLVNSLYDYDISTGWHRMMLHDTERILFVNRLSRNITGGQDVLVILLSNARLAAEMNPLPKVIPGANFVLLHQDGRVMYPFADAESVALPEQLAASLTHGAQGSLHYKRGGEDIIASYAVGSSGWALIAAGPRDMVLQDASYVWQVSCGIIIVGGLLSVLCILVFSRWLYRPFQQLLSTVANDAEPEYRRVVDEVVFIQNSIETARQEKTAYMDRWQAVAQVMTQQYLQLLLRGDRYAALETLPDALPRESCVIVAVMHLEDAGDPDIPLTQGRMLTFGAIERIAQELLADMPALRGNVLTQYPTGFTFLFFPEAGTQARDVADAVRTFLSRLREGAQVRLDIAQSLSSVGVGCLYEDQFDASLSYNEALMAMRYHLIGGNAPRIYFYDQIISEAGDISRSYPRAHEARILANLKEGELTAAKENLEAFGTQIQHSGSYTFCRQSYLLLFSGLLQALVRDDRTAGHILQDNPLALFEKCASLTQMQQLIKKQIFPHFEKLHRQEESDDSARRTVSLVQQYVVDHITSDLSLQQCAAHAGISSSHLSRIFKRISGTTFLEYVTNNKIEYVKSRLRHSQDNIGDIAMEVGYSERNLYRTFVKLVQMSPGAYREAHHR